jgi:uncharacterized membrane protein HdeD (DUF308 family)
MTTMASANQTIKLVLGVIMIVLGAVVALHPLWAPGRAVTGSVWMDMLFAALFLIRGVMNVRSARRAPRPRDGSVR